MPHRKTYKPKPVAIGVVEAIRNSYIIADVLYKFCALHRDDPAIDTAGLIEAVIESMEQIKAELAEISSTTPPMILWYVSGVLVGQEMTSRKQHNPHSSQMTRFTGNRNGFEL